jgi:hypothetical protein
MLKKTGALPPKKAKYYTGVLCLSFVIETDLLYTDK